MASTPEALEPQLWRHAAACAGSDPTPFFPRDDLDEQVRRDLEHQALQVCSRCPVRVPCLQYSRVTGQEYGVWGGLTPSMRHQRATR